jgi:mannose-1-phosphate guanylyltransferase/phosphomannomutase
MDKSTDIKVVILAGSRDFGRCPLASSLPISLWPIVDKPAIEHLLGYLVDQGITKVTVCSNGDAQLLEDSITPTSSVELKFMDEALPVGTAGCIRHAAKNSDEELLIVLPAGIMMPPAIDEILDEHHKADSDMTIMFNPSIDNNGALNDPAQIYVCQRSVLELIPDVGFCDIKESLIPEMLKAGKIIRAGKLSQDIGNFRSWPEYLKAIGVLLENVNTESPLLSKYKQNGSENVWLGNNVNIDDTARLLGPVIIGDHTQIAEDAIILGPAVIGSNVTIGKTIIVI